MKFENLTEWEKSVLVREGVLQLKEIEKAGISHEQLFAQLRGKELIHLGQVKCLYLEVTGEFSLVKNHNSIPGLSVIPFWDKEFIEEQKKDTSMQVCTYCGKISTLEQSRCNNCGSEAFTEALKAV